MLQVCQKWGTFGNLGKTEKVRENETGLPKISEIREIKDKS